MNYEKYDSLIMDISGSICYICDTETYDLLHLTQPGMDVYGFSGPESYRGKKCYEVLQGRDSPCPFCNNCKLSEGNQLRWEHYNDKLHRWFDITDTLIRVDGRLCRLEIARDISARKGQSLQEYSGSMSMEDVLFRCLHVLATEKNMNMAVNQFLSTVGSYYQAARTYIFEFDREKGVTNNTFEWCGPGVSREIDNLQDVPLEVVDDWIKKFESDGAFAISSVEGERDPNSEEYRLLQMQGISSLLAAPLLREQQIVGFIGVDDPGQNGGNPGLLRSVSEFIVAELERRRLMEELERASFTDILTGVFNRNGYRKTIRELLASPPENLGVLTISHNGLKQINETFGQKFGDEIIIRSAKKLCSLVSGQICRIGGDEFTVFCPNIPKQEFEAMAEKLYAAFLQEQDYSVSIGWDWDDGSSNVNDQLLRAENWMRTEKQRYYQDEISKGHTVGNAADDLYRDMENGCFTVYYQPQIDLRTGRVSGAEALVRKLDENGRIIPPSQFIPYYEARNILQHLDMHILELVLADLQKLRRQGILLHASVNFSRTTILRNSFAAEVCKLCADYGISPSDITVEITETVAEMSRDALCRQLGSIRQAGLKLSLDDFGTEYSNLSILTDVEFDEVKFDKTLVDDICTSGRNQIVLGRLMQMCRQLQQSRIVAEGIEDAGQVEILKSYGCDCGQGYYFHKPMSFGDLVSLLQSCRSFETAEVQKTSDSFLTGQDYALRYTLEEVLLRLISGGGDIYGYRIEGRRGLFSPRIAQHRNVPEQVYDFPQWVVDHKQVSEDSAGDWLAMFSAIHRGDKHGSAKVSFKVDGGSYHQYYLRFNSFADEEGNPFFATISFENVEHENERSRQQSQDIAGLLQAIQKNFPEILTLNLTRNTYRMFSYHSGTTVGTPKEGIIDDMIALRKNAVLPEDRDAFVSTFNSHALYQSFIREEKDYLHFVYRRPGKDGSSIWFETVVMRQDNTIDSDVLLVAMSRSIDEQKAAEVRLQEQLWLQAEELRVTTGRMRRTICFYDIAEKTLTLPADYAKAHNTPQVICNYPESLLNARSGMSLDTQKKIRAFYNAIQQGEPEGTCEVYSVHPQFGTRWKRWEFATVYDRDGAPRRAVIFVEDVTEQHQHELAYRRMVQAMESGKAGQLLVLECDLTADRMDKMGGKLLPAGQYINKTYSEFARLILETRFEAEERVSAEQYFSIHNLTGLFLQGERQLESQWRLRFQDGSIHYIKAEITLMEDPYDTHLKAFLHLTDVTEQTNAQLEIKNRAERDGMTGLLNRATAQELICRLMVQKAPGILIHIDLDDLKQINDHFGHREGDRALQGIADTLRQHFRESDVVARIGGDEFLVYLPGAAANKDPISASVASLLRKLTVISVGSEDSQRIHCSIGCALQENQDQPFDELYKQADIALYHVKRSGKNNYAFYAPEMEQSDYNFKAQRFISLRSTKSLDATELRYLPAAISDFYQLVLSMNLSTNGYFLMDEITDGVFSQLPTYGTMDDFVTLVCQAVHPDDRKAFMDTLSRDALLKLYEQGQSGVRHCFRFPEKDVYRCAEVSVIFYTNENGDVCDFTMVRWAPEMERA